VTNLRTVFLVNPASANGSTGRRWPEIARRAAAAGLQGEPLFSRSAGELTELARSAADDGAELLVVVGGDGSIHEVVNGIASREGVEIAVIVRGTGWDFARSLGLPRNLDRGIEVALSGRPRVIDLGRATYRLPGGGEGQSYFANVASAGMSGAIAQRANDSSKALGGKVSYILATFAVFARWTSNEIRVSVDGETRHARMHDVIVANGLSVGGGMKLCPGAKPDDGIFDVLLIGDLTKRDLVLTMPKIFRGTHLPHPKAELLQGSSITVDAAEPLPIQLDGEQPGTTPARFEIVPQALRVRVPAD
jgi:diacylglycerol kinase (ATP)